nr:MAG TPA: Protein of unknown function (DUF4090) [Bacteriophage sp.]
MYLSYPIHRFNDFKIMRTRIVKSGCAFFLA